MWRFACRKVAHVGGKNTAVSIAFFQRVHIAGQTTENRRVLQQPDDVAFRSVNDRHGSDSKRIPATNHLTN